MTWPFRKPKPSPLSRDEEGRFTSDYRKLVIEKARAMRASMPEREWKTVL